MPFVATSIRTLYVCNKFEKSAPGLINTHQVVKFMFMQLLIDVYVL